MSDRHSAAAPRTGPRRAIGVLALSGGLLLGGWQIAAAQFFDDPVLPPRVVAWRLADRGFSGLSRPRFDGRVYVVEAVSPAGTPVRLFVDPVVGAVVGRQRLGEPGVLLREGAPREAYARLERTAPGFGWTEEEAAPRRILRAPPETPAAPAGRAERRPEVPASQPEGSASRPEGGVRGEPQRKVARAAAPSPRQPDLKPALRATPEAPAPQAPMGETPQVAEPKVAEPPPGDRAAKAPAEAAATAARPGAPSAGTVATPEGARIRGDRAEAGKPGAPDWKDPPTERRPVRVIGGATVVPGTAAPGAAEREATP